MASEYSDKNLRNPQSKEGASSQHAGSDVGNQHKSDIVELSLRMFDEDSDKGRRTYFGQRNHGRDRVDLILPGSTEYDHLILAGVKIADNSIMDGNAYPAGTYFQVSMTTPIFEKLKYLNCY